MTHGETASNEPLTTARHLSLAQRNSPNQNRADFAAVPLAGWTTPARTAFARRALISTWTRRVLAWHANPSLTRRGNRPAPKPKGRRNRDAIRTIGPHSIQHLGTRQARRWRISLRGIHGYHHEDLRGI